MFEIWNGLTERHENVPRMRWDTDVDGAKFKDACLTESGIFLWAGLYLDAVTWVSLWSPYGKIEFASVDNYEENLALCRNFMKTLELTKAYEAPKSPLSSFLGLGAGDFFTGLPTAPLFEIRAVGRVTVPAVESVEAECGAVSGSARAAMGIFKRVPDYKGNASGLAAIASNGVRAINEAMLEQTLREEKQDRTSNGPRGKEEPPVDAPWMRLQTHTDRMARCVATGPVTGAKCASCGGTEKTKRCYCKKVFYCNVECQKKDRPQVCNILS